MHDQIITLTGFFTVAWIHSKCNSSPILSLTYFYSSLLINNILLSSLHITCDHWSSAQLICYFAHCSLFLHCCKLRLIFLMEFYLLFQHQIIFTWLFLNWQTHQYHSIHFWWRLITFFYLGDTVFLFIWNQQMWCTIFFYIFLVYFLLNLSSDIVNKAFGIQI